MRAMPSLLISVVTAVGAYLLGSLSPARLVARWAAPGADLAVTRLPVPGSGETWTYRGVSAMSLLGRARARWGLLVIALDLLKALIPTLALRLIWPDGSLPLTAAAGVFTGHLYPIWHRFQGGRGQACLLGAMLVIDPILIPAGLAAGALVGLLVFTSTYAARNTPPLFLIPLFALREGWGPGLWFALWVSTLYALAIVPDVREEMRVQRALGTGSLPWRKRVRLAWAGFTDRTVA